jgi:hypothetical protein
MTKEETVDDITLYTIAQVKAYAYCEEYNPTTGRTEQKRGYLLLKEGYVDGFMAGFAHRLTGGSND